MLVLFDMEWIEKEFRMYYPTQLAAIRVNSKWEVVDRYSSLIKPYEATCYDERHVAYSGATQGAFLTAKSAIRVFGELEKWFCEDDKVCCWNHNTVSRYLQMTKIILKKKTKANFYAVGNRAKELMEDGTEKDVSYKYYKINDYESAKQIFEFFAYHTNIEWGLINLKDINSQETYSYLAT